MIQHEVCQSAGRVLEVEGLNLQHCACGCTLEDDRESNVSTDSGNSNLQSEVGDDFDGDNATTALMFSSAETVVIFDWDDTLLPTSWLHRESLMPQQSVNGRLGDQCQHGLTVEQQEQLHALAESAERTLRVAKEHGQLVIITNGSEGWVQYSCMRYLPGIVPLLSGVKIVSARSSYEPFGHSQDMWKCLAFQELINDAYGTNFLGKQRNILSAGDSMHEHKALLYATKGIPNCHAKFLKFSECPDVDHLTEEHKLLSECLQWAIHHNDDLDLEIAEESQQ